MFRVSGSQRCFFLLLLMTVWLPVKVFCSEKPTPEIHFTPEEKAWIEQHPEISMSFMLDLQPAVIENEDGSLSGLIPDYIKLFEEKTGIRFHIKTWPTWKETLAAGIEREVDIIGPIPSLPAHARNYHFSLPFADASTHVYGPKHSHIPGHSMEGLKGRRVGYLDSLLFVKNFTKKHPDVDFKTYKTSPELITAMERGEIDFFIHVEWFDYYLNQNGYTDYRHYLTPPELHINGYLGSRSDWPVLTIILNKILAYHHREIEAINQKWLTFDNTIKLRKYSVDFNDEEKNWLANHPIIRVGIDPSWAPVEFTNNEGEPKGISPQYLKRIEDTLGVRFEPEADPLWKNSYEKLVRRDVDLLPAIASTTARREQVLFTQPYISLPLGIFSSVDRAYLGDLTALRGKTVVVVEGHAIHDWLQRDYPSLHLVTAPTLEDALNEVVKGNAYALIGNMVTTSYYIGQSNLNQIKVVGETEYTYDLAMAVRQDWEMLPGLLQKAINAISEDEKNAIYNKWISIEYEHRVDYTTLMLWMAGASTILLIFFYWNRRLSCEVAHRRKAEVALIDSTQQAEQAKVKAEKAAEVKSEFLANMSHEIRTPMNSVISAGHLLNQTPLSVQQQEYLNILSHSADALLETINGILDFSKGEANKLKLKQIDFHIDDILFRLKQLFRLQASEKALELSIRVDPTIPDMLRGDTEKLGQILRNLISNAIKFTDEGSVAIKASLIGADEHEQQATIRFGIQDTGIGIPQEIQRGLFQPFHQADTSMNRVHGGTGLGLAISHQLASIMGGNIRLESSPETGSLFELDLPFTVVKKGTSIAERPKLNGPETPERIQPLPELAEFRVLLVEDQELNRFLGKNFLELFGAQVGTAADGRKALEILEQETFDLIFMDIQMPHMNGYETTQTIRENPKWQTVPIIALSAHTLSDERDKCLDAGMNDYLSKPFKPEQLRSILLKWAQVAK